MDFRTCPACQASVLEDDVTECPFCGASMTTGKPVGKAQPKAVSKTPPTASPTPSQGAPAKSGTGSASKKPATKSSIKEDTSDPFDVDTSSTRNAIAVQPRPSKGRMLRIVCPMCEKAGFISPQDVGKDVKCANPNCLVPVFVAQSTEKEEPEPEPEVASGSGRMLMYFGLGLLVVAGIGAMFFLKGQKPVTSTGPLIDLTQSNGNNSSTDGTDETDPSATPAVPDKPAELSREEILEKALSEMQTAADYSEGGRARSYAARMLAEALMETGRADAARQKLTEVATAGQYLGIATLLIDAWPKLDAGDTAAGKSSIDEARESRASLPKQGRDALDIAGNLAAALIVTGYTDEAKSLATEVNDPVLGQLSTIWRGAIDTGKFRIESLERRSSLQDLPHPQWATVAQTLAIHRRWPEARQWVLDAPDVAIRDNCAAIVAAEIVANAAQPADVQGELDQLLAAIDGAGRVRIWVAIGQAKLERDDKPGATAAAQEAGTALDALTLPAPLKLPAMADLFKLASQPGRGLPEPAPLQSAALAALDLAEFQAQLGAQDQVLPRLEQGLQFLAGMAPNLSETQKLTEDNQRPAPIRRALAQTLDINETQAFAAFSAYQEQSLAWHNQADRRQQLELRLLDRVARAGAIEDVWKFVQARSTAADAASQQQWITTKLTGSLFQMARASALPIQSEIEAAVRSNRVPLDATDQALAAAAQLKVPAQRDAALRDLQTYYNRPSSDRYRVDRAVLAAVVSQSDWDSQRLVSFLTQLPEPLIREDALRLMAARRTRDGLGSPLVRDFNSRGLKETDRLAFFRGVVEGASAAERDR